MTVIKQALSMLLVCALSMGASDSFAQVYKCPNAKGVTVYSDRPCAPGAAQLSPHQLNANSLDSSGHRAQVARERNQREFEAMQRDVQEAARQQRAEDAATARQERQAQARQRPPRQSVTNTLPPSEAAGLRPPPDHRVITHCAGGFCYDDKGSTYLPPPSYGAPMQRLDDGVTCSGLGTLTCN